MNCGLGVQEVDNPKPFQHDYRQETYHSQQNRYSPQRSLGL